MDNAAFWEGFVKRADEVGFPLCRRSSRSQHLYAAADDRHHGVYYVFTRQADSIRVALALNNKHSGGRNAAYLAHLSAHKREIERAIGEILEWETDRRRLVWYVGTYVWSGGREGVVDDWRAVYDRMVEAMCRLQAAVGPYTASLPEVKSHPDPPRNAA